MPLNETRERIARWLDIAAVVSNNDPHFNTWQRVVPVAKLYKYFTVPAFDVVSPIHQLPVSYIVEQFNYSTDRPFTILDWPYKQLLNQNFVLCVRWRIGTVVYRYKFNPVLYVIYLLTEAGIPITDEDGHPLIIDNDIDNLPAVPLYTGQKIGANYVIEVWTLTGNANPAHVVFTGAQNFLTSIRFDPVIFTDANQQIPIAQITQNLWQPLPTNPPPAIFDVSGPWLDNLA